MWRSTLLITLLALLVLRCKKEDTRPELPTLPSDHNISLKHPQVGQTSRYVLLKGERYFDDSQPDAYSYAADTLVVELVDETATGFRIREYLTEFSASKSSPMPEVPFPDSVTYYEMQLQGDSVLFSSNEEFFTSRLLPFASRPFSLSVFQSNPTSFVGWKTELPYCECYREAFVEELSLFGYTYPDLNVIIDNLAMQVDGPGYTVVYSADAGWVRTYVVNWWTQTGQGWDLLP